MNTTEYKKLKAALIAKLSGLALAFPEYNQVIRVLHFAEGVHNGKRKDGSEEFYHQLNILGFAMNMHSMLQTPHLIYSAILLHDTVEDYWDRENEVREKFPEVYGYCVTLSKIAHGSKKDTGAYFSAIANCRVCSVAKGIDRIHNLSSMVKPFSIEKQKEYVGEAENEFLPMLKKARKNFPEMAPVYELIKCTINIQCSTIKACYGKSA